jgi:hypothetical protein
MITISITADAFAAIASTLPRGSTADAREDGKSGDLVTLERRILDRLPAMRRPGESYSDVILSLAKGDADNWRQV